MMDPASPRLPEGQAADDLPAEPLDAHAFGKLVTLDGEEPGFLAELVGEFEEGVTRRLEAIAHAIATADWPRLAAAAHSLRGSCGTVGARRMAALAGRLEDRPPATREEAAAELERLRAEYGALRRALEAALAGPRSAGTP